MSQEGPRPCTSRLRFLQFSCKTLLLLTFLAGLAFTWWSDRQEHRKAMKRLEDQLTVLQAASGYELWEDADPGYQPWSVCGMDLPPQDPVAYPIYPTTPEVLPPAISMGRGAPQPPPIPDEAVRVELAELFRDVEGWLSENFSENRHWKDLLPYPPPPEYYQPPLQYDPPRSPEAADQKPAKAIPVAKLLPVIRKLLRDGDSPQRLPTARKLIGLGSFSTKLVPDLMVALDDKDPRVRATIAVVLQGLEPASKAALPRLKEILASSEKVDAVMAAAAIVRMDPSSDVVPRLTELLARRDQDLETVDGVAAILWEFGPKKAAGAVPALYEMLRHKDPGVRDRAARLLSRLAPREDVIDSLTETLKNEKDPDVKTLMARIVLRLQSNVPLATGHNLATPSPPPRARGAWPASTTMYR